MFPGFQADCRMSSSLSSTSWCPDLCAVSLLWLAYSLMPFYFWTEVIVLLDFIACITRLAQSCSIVDNAVVYQHTCGVQFILWEFRDLLISWALLLPYSSLWSKAPTSFHHSIICLASEATHLLCGSLALCTNSFWLGLALCWTEHCCYSFSLDL